ncbi:MAG TPA: hypothetical protein VK211_21365, partial [Kamptonema sp.]|nr:hypothetical protein [Kamptonema sp.]
MASLFIFNLFNLTSCTIVNQTFRGGQGAALSKKFTLCRIGILPVFVLLAILLPGCTRRATDAQLAKWQAEAIARNDAIVAQRSKNSKPKEWELLISGQIAKSPQRLSWAQLDAIASTRIATTSPHNTKNPKAILYFRGIAVSQLLDRFGVKPDAANVT